MRVSVITGGTRGIGYAIAAKLLAQGDAVAITGTSQHGVDRATAALRELAADATRVMALACDVRDAPAMAQAFDAVASHWGGIDVLVNNAGVGVFAPVADMSVDEWNRVIGTNLTGVFHCSNAVLPHLRRRHGGWIINISSLASKNPFVGGAAYSASKAALNAFSEAFMQEVRHEHIRVAYVLPGSVATEFSGRAAGTGADWRLLPEDVAAVVVDLLSHPARSLPSRVEIRPSRPQKS
jgi:NAD(P)-dependent dehydrogenase (short-subunit alcohol dehydrogenase family)